MIAILTSTVWTSPTQLLCRAQTVFATGNDIVRLPMQKPNGADDGDFSIQQSVRLARLPEAVCGNIARIIIV